MTKLPAPDLPLVAFDASPDRPPAELRVAPARRVWMDQTRDGFAYRCLPLVMANQFGWEVLCPASFSAVWNGGADVADLEIRFGAEPTSFVESHFGHGILTFQTGHLFRTPAGHNLWITGPANRPKDGVAALEGLIETDWGPHTATMNWQLTRADWPVRFEAGEPIARILPYPRGYAQRFRPRLAPIGSDPALAAAYAEWRASRKRFNAELDDPASESSAAGWQKHYMQGVTPDGDPFPPHERKLDLRPFGPSEGARAC